MKNMFQYIIFHPRVIVWTMWLISQGLFAHLMYLLGHKSDYKDLELRGFKAHAVLSTFSTLGLLSNGSVLFRLVPVFATKRMKWVHMCVFVIACGLSAFDLVLIYIATEEKKPKHFLSPHAIFGILTYFIISLMVSFYVFLF